MIHLAMLVVPFSLWVFPRGTLIPIMGGAVLIAFVVEFFRRSNKTFSKYFNWVVGRFLRPQEAQLVCGATYFLTASFLTILFFHQEIASCVLFILIFADSAAAFVGRNFGKRPILGKTLEGSLAFFVVALGIVLLSPGVPFRVGLTGAVTATIVELLPIPIDDNFTIPLAAGVVMEMLL